MVSAEILRTGIFESTISILHKMEIALHRIDYAQIGTTSKSSMAILPAVGPISQRVTVASQSGVLLCFHRKNNDTALDFKTLPGPRMDALSLGGALGTPQDKIFVAATNMVKGFSKKGKQFFAFETNLTEPILSMHIYGVDMFLCGTYTFNHFHDCAEANYYLCGDRINHVVCLPVTEGSWVGRGITPILACDDRTLKAINGSNLAYQLEVGGAPNILHLYQNTGGADGQELLYGTKDGRVGLAQLPASDPYIKWEIASPNGHAAVNAIDCYDITGDGILDLIVARDDGLVEIYVYDEDDRPKLKQTYQCTEGITSLQCGRINSPHFDEIVVCTYAGWLVGLTTEPQHKKMGGGQEITGRPMNKETEEKIERLRTELEELQQRVNGERERYQNATQTEHGLSAVPVFPINDRFALNRDDAAYSLTIELQVPIDYVLLQCDVPVDLLDVEKNSAVVSMTPCDASSGNALLATYRCQANTTRLEIRIRSIEGQYGTLQAYVSPRLHPKVCQVRQYPIKPLSLHQRTQSYDSSRPQNVLRLAGSFTVAESHSWVSFCLPELPEKPPASDRVQYCFVSTFVGSQLECVYQKGSAVFRSDNVTVIAILRDVISKEATKRKLKLDMSCDISDESVIHILRLLHPKLEYQLSLAKKVHLAEALKELKLNENDTSFLTPDMLDVMREADKLQSEQKKQQTHLERIYGIVTDLFIDKFKFKGQNVKQQVPQLLQLLENYNFDNLVQFFQS